MKPSQALEDASQIADEAVQCAQTLGDIFIRLVDRPDVQSELELTNLVTDVLVAFARHFFAGRALLAAVAKELEKSPAALELASGSWDF